MIVKFISAIFTFLILCLIAYQKRHFDQFVQRTDVRVSTENVLSCAVAFVGAQMHRHLGLTRLKYYCYLLAAVFIIPAHVPAHVLLCFDFCTALRLAIRFFG